MTGRVNIIAIETVALSANLLSGGEPDLSGSASYVGFSDGTRKLSLQLQHQNHDLSADLSAYLNGDVLCVLTSGQNQTQHELVDCDIIDVSDILEIRDGETVLLIGVFNET